MSGWVAGAIVVSAVAGAAVSSDSSRRASNTQKDAAEAASRQQAEQYNSDLKNNLPRMQRGDVAGNRLQYLMGLDNGSSGSAGDNGRPAVFDRDQLRQQLVGQYTSNVNGYDYDAYNQALQNVPEVNSPVNMADYQAPAVIDEYALNAEIDKRLQAQQDNETLRQSAIGAQADDPNYGILTRRFGQSDLDSDVVYQNGLQFGLDEGRKAIERQAASRGGRNAGALIKAVERFGVNYGSTKANESENRFTNYQANTYNKLAGLNNTAQVASNQIQASGQNMTNNMGQNTIGAGNARASGYLAQGNALTNGLSQGFRAYQQQSALDNYQPNTWGNNSGSYQAGSGTTDASYWQ